ncbi:oxygenase MpaB family protein [Streptomyces sp. NPDC059740]|uniref:oxygenase MpaB family protein n=1 Tax=Streptomyces sp. NPDC059740 TaxID=3346926 RepID=UPI0036688AA1
MSDEEQAHTVYRRLALVDFADELRMGLNLGFYRTFAVPSIARVLVGTGKMSSRPVERAKATGALMYALIDHGLEAPAGRAAVETLSRLHRGLPVGDEEFVYVLAAFCVAPLRHIDRIGWRPTTAEERAAAHAFYAGLAARMGITGVPGSYEALGVWMDRYEARTFAATAEGRALMEATFGILAERLPSALGPLARTAAAALFDERLLQATGIRPASRAVRWAMRVGLSWKSRRSSGRWQSENSR